MIFAAASKDFGAQAARDSKIVHSKEDRKQSLSEGKFEHEKERFAAAAFSSNHIITVSLVLDFKKQAELLKIETICPMCGGCISCLSDHQGLVDLTFAGPFLDRHEFSQ